MGKLATGGSAWQLPSHWGAAARVKKNWLVLVFLPPFAMDRTPSSSGRGRNEEARNGGEKVRRVVSRGGEEMRGERGGEERNRGEETRRASAIGISVCALSLDTVGHRQASFRRQMTRSAFG